MSEAVSTALLGILIIAGALYGTLRWIVLDVPPTSEESRGPP
ncbi:MAG: hypothetical protein ACM35G_12725 [Planctomycetaceae bacterium]